MCNCDKKNEKFSQLSKQFKLKIALSFQAISSKWAF